MVFCPELLRVSPVRAIWEIDVRRLCVKIFYEFTGQNPVTIVKLHHSSDVVTVIIVFIQTKASLICWFSFATALKWIDPNNNSMLVSQNMIAQSVGQLLLTLVSAGNVDCVITVSSVSPLSWVRAVAVARTPTGPSDDVIRVIIFARETFHISKHFCDARAKVRMCFVCQWRLRYSGICHDASGINL